MRILAGLAGALMIVCPMISLDAQSSKAVKDFTPCDVKRLTIARTDRFPARPMVRTVETSKGERDVTMVDGYRILYLLGSEELILNMKMEALEPSKYQEQKADLVDSLDVLTRDPTIDSVDEEVERSRH